MDDMPRFTMASPYAPAIPIPPVDPSYPSVGTNLALPLTAEKAAVIQRVTVGRVARHLWATPFGIACLIAADATLTGSGIWSWLRQAAPDLARAVDNENARNTTTLLGQHTGIVTAWVGGIVAVIAFIVLLKIIGAGLRATQDLLTARRDLQDGTYLVASGPFSVRERTRGEDGPHYWTLSLHDCAIAIPRSVFERLRTVKGGSIAYARYTRCIFEVQDESGAVCYRAPGSTAY